MSTEPRQVHSTSDNWSTPEEIKEYICDRYTVSSFDPCPAPNDRPDNFDGLRMDWSRYDGVVFANPPYSNLSKWVKKAWKEFKKGQSIILLIPSNRMESDYVLEYLLKEVDVRIEFLTGRLKYGCLDDPDRDTGCARFGSMLVYMFPSFNELNRV